MEVVSYVMVEAINMWGPLVCSLHQLWMMHKIILPCKPLHAHFSVLLPLQSNPSVGKEPKNDWEWGDCVLNQIIMSGYLLYRSLRWDSHNFDSRIPSAIHTLSPSVDADLIIIFILPPPPPPVLWIFSNFILFYSLCIWPKPSVEDVASICQTSPGCAMLVKPAY